MSLRTRHAKLDASGSGGIEAPTSAYAGCIDSGSALVLANNGFGLSHGPLKQSDWVPVQGSIHITGGTPLQDVVLFFDF